MPFWFRLRKKETYTQNEKHVNKIINSFELNKSTCSFLEHVQFEDKCKKHLIRYSV